MKRILLNVVILFFVGWIAAYLVLGGKPLQRRAMDAYNKGDYRAALPLFKKWGEMPDVRKDPKQQQAVLAYIIDIQNKLAAATATGPATASTAPVDQAQLMQQAMAFALDQSKAMDPALGADRVPHKPLARGETRTLTIKQLANFEFDPIKDKEIPPDVAALEGAHLRLNGFMIPLTQANKINKFALVPSLVSCCFGQPPGVQHVITVNMEPGQSTDYSLDELYVEGVLHVNIQRQDGYTFSIFELSATRVQVRDN